MARIACRTIMVVFHALGALFRCVHLPRRHHGGGQRVLLTGQFLSDAWLRAHARPLALSSACDQVFVVSECPLVAMQGVQYLCPSPTMRKLFGQAGSRYLKFALEAVRHRPDVVGGFHLLCNGLLAQIVGRFVGAKSMYFCVGGWSEVEGGGAHGENRLFGMMGSPDRLVERALERAVRGFDIIITMGSRAKAYLQSRGVTSPIHVLPGGIDPGEFVNHSGDRKYDLIGVFRLVPVKRIDIFIRSIAEARKRIPNLRAVIVGDGRLADELKALRDELGLTQNIDFVGHQTNVPIWLGQSRAFLLTSDSEGVALSVMEALTSGLPVIVSDVGDMRDVIRDGENGYLVPRREITQFADAIVKTLSGNSDYAKLATRARESAGAFTVERTAERWDEILGIQRPVRTHPRAAPEIPVQTSR